MAASGQEQVLGMMSKYSFGSPYLYEPNEYRIGNGVREPADLVWWSRDVLILMAMQANSRSYAAQVTHNLRQLRGFLRLWDAGIGSLAGSNEWQSFEPKPDDQERIVLLSIVACRDARAEVLTEFMGIPRNALEARVSMCATIPESILLTLAERGGSACDLADFLLQVAQYPNGVAEQDALTLLLEQHRDAGNRARVGRRPDREQDLDRRSAMTILVGLRMQPRELIYNAQAHQLGSAAVFNDIDWETTIRLALTISDLYRLVRDVPVGEIGPRYAVERFDSAPYGFVIGVCDIRQANEMGERAAALYAELETLGRCPVAINVMLVGRPVVQLAPAVIAISRKQVTSVTSSIFDEANN